MTTLRQFFIDGAIAALVRQKEAYAKSIAMMEDDISKIEKMNNEEFELHFFAKCKPGMQDIQFLAGRFDPSSQESQPAPQDQQAPALDAQQA